MATEVKLPELGDGIESGDVLEVFVSVGDVIKAITQERWRRRRGSLPRVGHSVFQIG